MFKTAASTLTLLMLFLFASAPPLTAQDMADNGNFELAALGPWSEYGDTTGTGMVMYDVDATGGPTNCFKRMPGTDFGNGGIKQSVLLIGGVTYQFDADIAYYSC